MIDKLKGGHYQAICDCCYDGFDALTRAEAMQLMADNGWRTIKGEHYCTECLEAMTDGG